MDDVAAEVAQLRARGVQIQDLPEPGPVDGISPIGRHTGNALGA